MTANTVQECDIINQVRDLVFVDQKIVTFNYIAKQYKFDIPKAKEVLQKIVDNLKNEQRTDFISSFYITGYAKDSDPQAELKDDDFLRWNVMEADSDELEEHKKDFFSIVDGVTLRSIRSSDIVKRDKDLYAKPTLREEDLQAETATACVSKVEDDNSKTPLCQKVKEEVKEEEKVVVPKQGSEKFSKDQSEKKPEKEKMSKEVKVKAKVNVEPIRVDDVDDEDDEEEVVVKRKKRKESFLNDSPVKHENGTKRKSLDEEENEEKPESKKSKRETNEHSNGSTNRHVKREADLVSTNKSEGKKQPGKKESVRKDKEPAKKAPNSANSSKGTQQKRITDFFGGGGKKS